MASSSNIPVLIVLPILWALLPFFYLFKLLTFILRRFRTENLRGKVVLITGASSGIGEHLTYEYAKRGACLVIVARRENLLIKVAEKARQLGSPDVLHICANVRKADDCRDFVEKAVNHFGRLDHVVNNAGIACMCFIEDTADITKFTEMMDVNFWGSVYPTYFAIPHLKKTRGSVFVNASAGGILNPPGMSIYSASKAALLSFCDTMSVELAPEISVTVATLGVIDSEITQGGKQLTMEGTMDVKSYFAICGADKMPSMGASDCAEAIVDAICQKERCVTEPKWYMILLLLKTLFPDLIEWTSRRTCLMLKTNVAKTALLTPPSQDKIE
ncbi:OLC1v1035606C1 [Oldenlandia corymbosa var. corymbosa]|uniref:OLC1v1035606C1 n=1 Tax=Oldenlandia corymbosa var. corymbosa TaxID=529605 RepID=A0AAV1CWH5_OLDCO|nr:OLC1v1035606C1 [Oldenlandia corymbosa var. corymbosa]